MKRNEGRVIHDLRIAEFGGGSGMRDVGLFESAMDRPRNLFACGEPRPALHALAAAYAFGLEKNRAFVDGNKRTARAVCFSFVAQNGVEIAASQEQRYLTFCGVDSGEVSETEMCDWLRLHRGPGEGSE